MSESHPRHFFAQGLVMSKLPWAKFYPADWLTDLHGHPLDIIGAWIMACAEMMRRGVGELAWPLERWGRFWGVSTDRAAEIVDYLHNEEIADRSTSHDLVTLMSRRLSREYKAKEKARLRKQRERVSRSCHASVTGQKSEVRNKQSEVRKKS